MAKKNDSSQKYGWKLGQRHPIRNQFENFYQGRPELSGTPSYGNDWLKLRAQAPRFRGIMPKGEREAEEARQARKEGRGGGGGGGAAPININMFTSSEDRSVTNTTTNNYMAGRGFVDDGAEPAWGSPGGEFEEAGFGDAAFEPMDHDLYNVRQRGGGGWTQPSGELGSGSPAIGPGDSSGALGI